MELYTFQFMPIASCPVPGQHWEESGSIFFMPHIRYLSTCSLCVWKGLSRRFAPSLSQGSRQGWLGCIEDLSDICFLPVLRNHSQLPWPSRNNLEWDLATSFSASVCAPQGSRDFCIFRYFKYNLTRSYCTEGSSPCSVLWYRVLRFLKASLISEDKKRTTSSHKKTKAASHLFYLVNNCKKWCLNWDETM